MAPTKKPATPVASKKKLVPPQTPGTEAAMQGIRNYLIIAIGVTVLVVLVGGYFIYTLAQSNVKKALEVRAQEYQIKLSENKIAKLDEAEPEILKLKQADGDKPSRFDFITQRTLPENEDFEAILTIFNRLQKDYQVDIESITKPGTATAGVATTARSTPNTTGAGKSQSSLIAIKATGSQEAVISFLQALESSSRIFDFSTMKISSEQGSFSLDMQYKIYAMPKPSINSTDVKIDEYEADKGKYE
ncbi:hypothetical protein IPM44_00565 [bacterium]|nr:MAG: hypothetical protein IPM44_00565 [bacterium]